MTIEFKSDIRSYERNKISFRFNDNNLTPLNCAGIFVSESHSKTQLPDIKCTTPLINIQMQKNDIKDYLCSMLKNSVDKSFNEVNCMVVEKV